MQLTIGTGEPGRVTVSLTLKLMEPGTKMTGDGRISLGLHPDLDKATYTAGTLTSIADHGSVVTVIELTGWTSPPEVAANRVNLRGTIKLCSDRPDLGMANLSYIAHEGGPSLVLRNLPVTLDELTEA